MGAPANTTQAATAPATVVVGLGVTGLSCARYLARRGETFAVADSRAEPPGLEALRAELPQVETRLGPLDAAWLASARRLVVSPGLSPDEPALAEARRRGAELLGDIELFAREVQAPVVAITGSNGKSTVTTLVGEMARAAGKRTAVGGNLGTPALELLAEQPDAELYVLELSSFQLEPTESLRPAAAVVLNVSDDHLDRHGDLARYAAVKARIYRGAGVAVVNVDDPLVAAMPVAGRAVGFTLGEPSERADWGLRRRDGRVWLAHGTRELIACDELRIAGRHNQANALAALALGAAVGLPEAAMLDALRRFAGLPHRCQWVAERGGIHWYDDSKGTNVGSTLAALAGMPGERVLLIAGGRGKGADYAPLREVVAQRARAVVLIGEEARRMGAALDGTVPLLYADSMAAAVAAAVEAAQAGDSVLLSPACASFDMFDNYMHRGQVFAAAVRELAP